MGASGGGHVAIEVAVSVSVTVTVLLGSAVSWGWWFYSQRRGVQRDGPRAGGDPNPAGSNTGSRPVSASCAVDVPDNLTSTHNPGQEETSGGGTHYESLEMSRIAPVAAGDSAAATTP